MSFAVESSEAQLRILPGGFQNGDHLPGLFQCGVAGIIVLEGQDHGDLRHLVEPRRLAVLAANIFLSGTDEAELLAVAAARLDEDAARVADELDAARRGAVLCAGTLADEVGVFQQEDAAGVDAVLVEIRMVAHQHGFAEQPHHEMYIIKVQVHQRAAAAGRVKYRRHLPGEQGIVPAGILAEGTGDDAERANVVEVLLCKCIVGVVGRGDGLEEEEVLLFRQCDELVSLRHGRDEGLLAEDVLSGQKRRLGLRIVQAVGGGDIDQLNVRVGQHGVIVGVDLRDAELLCQRLAGGLLPGADRLTAECRDLCKLCHHRAGDGASAEDADIHRNALPYI